MKLDGSIAGVALSLSLCPAVCFVVGKTMCWEKNGVSLSSLSSCFLSLSFCFLLIDDERLDLGEYFQQQHHIINTIERKKDDYIVVGIVRQSEKGSGGIVGSHCGGSRRRRR